MKATFRIVTPAAAVSAAAAALLLTGCADKPVRVPGGAFYDEPYQGGSGTTSQAQTQPVSAGEEEIVETEIIYIENDVPVGPVENDIESAGQSQAGSQQVQDRQPEVKPVETAKSNVPEGSVEYKVVKGDTLWGIGMVYGVSVQRLAEINGIDEKAPLRVGQVLMIPPDAKNAVGKPIPQKKTETKPATTTTVKPADNTKKTTTSVSAKPIAKEGESLYVVKSGDSLSVIAQRHHVKLADLVAANKIDPKATLRIGQTLVIPAASASAASSTKTSAATTSTTTKPATTTTKPADTTKPATTTTKPADTTKPATTTPARGGEGTGGVVEPIGGSSSGVTAPATTTPAASSGSSLPTLNPVSEVPDLDVISVPIDSELTLEEVANIHDRNLQDLIRLNPDFKPGQKIPAGTTVRMPLF
ncbi:MAG: LysM peptidoglycan-binding domain-containing protein [Lentisphaeria bacterium]|nr:LysM peptidoglycan-binding domain-containing protein [Lentisphaeria bacterium]